MHTAGGPEQHPSTPSRPAEGPAPPVDTCCGFITEPRDKVTLKGPRENEWGTVVQGVGARVLVKIASLWWAWVCHHLLPRYRQYRPAHIPPLLPCPEVQQSPLLRGTCKVSVVASPQSSFLGHTH